MEQIDFNEFKKIDLRIAEIISAERVDGSVKLMKLQVDLGDLGKRQIIAGIGDSHDAEELRGTQVVIVSNLEQKMIMGNESAGMLLASRGVDETPILLVPESRVESGSLVS